MYVLRARGASVPPNFYWAGHRKNTTHHDLNCLCMVSCFIQFWGRNKPKCLREHPLLKCPRRHIYYLPKRDTKNERSAAMFYYYFRQLEIEISAGSSSHEECSYSYDVLSKIIPKGTPSLVLYTDIPGSRFGREYTERYLSSGHPNRCFY